MTHDKVRQDFEKATESYYEGDFAKYGDGDYVSSQQQDDFTMFQSGYQAGRAAERAEIREKLKSEGVIGDVSAEIWNNSTPSDITLEAVEACMKNAAKAAITKILEVI